MIRPHIDSDGRNNWHEVDWDDIDIGEYTNLCPDKQRSDFEYGSIVIVENAMSGPIEQLLEPTKLPPSKITRELQQVIQSLDRLSPDTLWHLQTVHRLREPVKRIRTIIQMGIDHPRKNKTSEPDGARNELGENAWSIWFHHGGDIHSPEFLGYVERLLQNANFVSDARKGRVNPENLVHQIRRASEQGLPPSWSLWG
jgi:hypothetical protein